MMSFFTRMTTYLFSSSAMMTYSSWGNRIFVFRTRMPTMIRTSCGRGCDSSNCWMFAGQQTLLSTSAMTSSSAMCTRERRDEDAVGPMRLKGGAVGGIARRRSAPVRVEAAAAAAATDAEAAVAASWKE